MAAHKVDKAAQMAALPIRADEDPFVVAIGGFYRRWFNLIDDLQVLIDTVKTVKGTEDEDWVPVWSAVAERYEKEAEALLKKRKRAEARAARDALRTGFRLKLHQLAPPLQVVSNELHKIMA